MEFMKKIFKNLAYALFPGMQSITAFILMLLFMSPNFWMFINARKLGLLFLPLFFGYDALLATIYAYILHRRTMQDIRGLAGDELYFKTYPKEKIREERIKKLKKIFHIN